MLEVDASKRQGLLVSFCVFVLLLIKAVLPLRHLIHGYISHSSSILTL
jgi:hypothetical protein